MKFVKKLFILAIGFSFFGCQSGQNTPILQGFTGITMGVVPYSIKYQGAAKESIKLEVDSILNEFNNSLSTYVSSSEISELNANATLKYRSEYFYPVIKSCADVFEATNGAFDPTVGPLVNKWGFGPGEITEIPDSAMIDSILTFTGFEKIQFNAEGATMNLGMYLDFSAIAKGYAVDLIAEYLEGIGLHHFMVEIGGEVRCKGKKSPEVSWVIGVEDPTVETSAQKLAARVKLENVAMATSGNYRNFYIKDGKKYAHTISPYTGFPVEHSLLSASVFSSDCMTADAYATAFMVIGLEKSKEILRKDSSLNAHLIFEDENGALKSYTSQGIAEYFIKE